MAQPFDYSTLYLSLFLTLTLSLFFHGQIISLSARLLGETPITLLHGPVLALHWPCISPYSGFPSAFATLVPACLPFVWPRIKLKVREHNKTEYIVCCLFIQLMAYYYYSDLFYYSTYVCRYCTYTSTYMYIHSFSTCLSLYPY